LTFLEEQRIKRFLKDAEKFEMSITATGTGETFLPRAKRQLSFLKEQAMHIMGLMCGSEFCNIYERGLARIDHYLDQQVNLSAQM
jgi:hypothetical protein